MGSMASCFHWCSKKEKLTEHGGDPKGTMKEKGLEEEQLCGRLERGQRKREI